jgi:ubiquinone/menaquinone biosynthesis C-methylase UbiE
VAFARDAATHAYYDARAAEYDEWYAGTGRFAARERPGWAQEVEALVALVAALPPGRTLDVACGTAFLTRHLQGLPVGLDQSRAMVAIAQERLRPRGGLALIGDALALPFADGAFDRVLTGHFYGHLVPAERAAFLAEARRVTAAGGELVVIDSAPRDDGERERWEERVLNDGSRHRVYKRFLSGSDLAGELGATAEVLLDGRWFSAARARAASP